MAKAITTHGVQSMSYHVASVVDGSPLSVRQWAPRPEVRIRAVLNLPTAFRSIAGGMIALRAFSPKLGSGFMQATRGVTDFPFPSQSSARPACTFGRIRRQT